MTKFSQLTQAPAVDQDDYLPGIVDGDNRSVTFEVIAAFMAGRFDMLGTPVLPPSNDCNLITQHGIYTTNSSTLNSPGSNRLVLHMQGADRAFQVAGSAAATSLLDVKFRELSGAGWSSWQTFWHGANLEKTTSATDTTAGRLLRVGSGNFLGVPNAAGDLPGGGGINDTNEAPAVIHFYPTTGSTANGPGQSGTALRFQRGTTNFADLWLRDSAGSPEMKFRAGNLGGSISNWKDVYHTENTTVDSNGFVKEASPIVRLFDDGTQEPVQPVGAQFERLGVGEYRLSDVEPLAETGWQIEVPQDGNGNRLVFVATEYDPEARTLTIITSEPAWDGGWVAGEPKDIPDGRWVDLRFKPLPKPEEEGDA